MRANSIASARPVALDDSFFSSFVSFNTDRSARRNRFRNCDNAKERKEKKEWEHRNGGRLEKSTLPRVDAKSGFNNVVYSAPITLISSPLSRFLLVPHRSPGHDYSPVVTSRFFPLLFLSFVCEPTYLTARSVPATCMQQKSSLSLGLPCEASNNSTNTSVLHFLFSLFNGRL